MAKRPDAIDLDAELERQLEGTGDVDRVLSWIARFSLWVPPSVYRRIPVVYPETRRRQSKEKLRSVKDGLRLWSNEPASDAFWLARGSSRNHYSNFVVGHIYELSPYDPAHFTNLANLVALPKCLDSFSEWEPVRSCLKWHSSEVYGYTFRGTETPPRPRRVPAEPPWQGAGDLTGTKLEVVVAKLQSRHDSRPSFHALRGQSPEVRRI